MDDLKVYHLENALVLNSHYKGDLYNWSTYDKDAEDWDKVE